MTEEEARKIVRESRAKWDAMGGCMPTISEDAAVRFLLGPDPSAEHRPLTLAMLNDTVKKIHENAQLDRLRGHALLLAHIDEATFERGKR